MTVFFAKQSLGFRDARGHVGKVGYYYQYDDAAVSFGDNASNATSNIAAGIVGLSNASLVTEQGFSGRLYLPNRYGSSLEYPNVEDKARLVFLFGNPSAPPTDIVLYRMEIPAPKLSIFYADGETVNSASAPMVTFLTDFSVIDATGGRVVTRSGAFFIQFVGGYRVRRKLQRKLTLWDKSPNLDEPEE